MHIPRFWFRVSDNGKTPDGKTLPVTVWGWGEDDIAAKQEGISRLARVLERIRRGESFPDRYDYGVRPLREEIIESIPDGSGQNALAIVTRNGYGAEVLNTARVLFLDLDFRPAGLIDRIKRLFGGPSAEDRTTNNFRAALRDAGGITFRLYRTAAGLRAMAINQEFEPDAPDVQDLMRQTGTDPAYARLCRVQNSFRARLTPKPWRCNSPMPPGQHPRNEIGLQQKFSSWLKDYRQLSSGFSTCRYLETIGKGEASAEILSLVELHDRYTRAGEKLPLA